MTPEEQLVGTAVASWKLAVGRLNDIVAAADDDRMQKQVAEGRNRIAYLIGHLTAVHDRLFPMLFLGERLHPELDEPYLSHPDRTHPDPLSFADLRSAWTAVNEKLTAGIEALTPREWLQRHSAVSEEDFAKDPSRNRLAVLLSRTNHASMHLGQILLAK